VSTREMLARERRCEYRSGPGSDSVWGRTERSAGQRAFSLGRARLMHLSMEACQRKNAAQGFAGDERAEQVQGWQDRPGPHRIERVCGEVVMREKDDAARSPKLKESAMAKGQLVRSTHRAVRG
jgi:hypothetical protein